MACYRPLQAWRTKDGGITLTPRKASGEPLKVPCGRCIGCTLAKSRDWAIRCVHEASLHKDNIFITLTYNDDHLPENASLVPDHFTLFMKRFRKSIEPRQIRFYMCGEYGENFGRPHYHAIIFGYAFPDAVAHQTVRGLTTYVSEQLSELWGMGFCTIGAVTYESAAYCARYVLKKQYGQQSRDHYTSVDKETGEIRHRLPEYARMSRGTGLGKDWILKYLEDTYPADHVIHRGREVRVPPYYDRVLAKERGDEALATVKAGRVAKAIAHEENNSRSRLKVREKVQKHKLQLLKRSLA